MAERNTNRWFKNKSLNDIASVEALLQNQSTDSNETDHQNNSNLDCSETDSVSNNLESSSETENNENEDSDDEFLRKKTTI